MRVLLRADAGPEQGSGHVVRCMTLGEALIDRGHHVRLMGSIVGIPWLQRSLSESGLEILECPPDSLPSDNIQSLDLDWIVLDSYRIPAASISALNTRVPCLALVDGDTRSIQARLFLDQNLGADERGWPVEVASRMLSGPAYSLVRKDIVKHRRADTALLNDVPSIVAFMGGTDPRGAIIEVGRSLCASRLPMKVTLVVPETLLERSERLFTAANVDIVPSTPRLPDLLATADIAVSAAGTSAWDLCTMGIPSVLVALADNQQESLRVALRKGLALGVDIADGRKNSLASVGRLVEKLIQNASLRASFADRGKAIFDGRGSARVVSMMENAA